jgi:tRNA 2-thiouridine synthesizing protein A
MAAKFEKLGEGSFQLDVQGYVCPHPQIYTKKALEKLKTGDTLQLVFDNPSSGESISAMCQSEGNEIVDQTQDAGSTMRWTIRKS